ncbi:dromaiocalcin-1-like [Oculina patagonica]
MRRRAKRFMKRMTTSATALRVTLAKIVTVLLTMKYALVCYNKNASLHFAVGMPCGEDEGWTAFQSSCYKYFIQKLPWAEAATTCEELNATLAILNSAEEYEFLYNHGHVLPDNYKIWIGLVSVGNTGSETWAWVDGSVLTYHKWGPDQPTRDSAECVIALNGKYFRVQWSHEWNDRSCTRLNTFVCEKKQN